MTGPLFVILMGCQSHSGDLNSDDQNVNATN